MAGMSAEDADAFLGPPPAPKAPGGPMSEQDANEFLGPEPLPQTDDIGRDMPGADPAQDEYIKNSSLGKVLHAFGQGAADGWGAGDIGLSDESVAGLKKAGIFPDADKQQGGLLRAFNEALVRPAAAAIDAGMRSVSALQAGVTSAAVEGATQIGGEQFGRGVGGIAEATLADLGSRIPEHGAAPALDLPAARDLGVIGEPESVWKGTPEPLQQPAPEPARGAQPPAPAEVEPVEPTPPAPPLDVHGLARQIAPDTFSEFDTLTAHQDDLRQQIATETADLQQKAEAQAPHAAEIADLQDRLQDTTPRLAKKYQARLDALLPEHDAFLNDDFTMGALARDTPELGALRQQLLETQYRMRDLAPDVTEAYRKAAEQMPAEAEAPAAPAAAEPEQTGLPPVAEGSTRFYHGGENPTAGGPRDLTPDLKYAQAYADKSGSPVHYVDVRNDHPSLVKIFDDEGSDVKSPFGNFTAPEDIAKQLKPIKGDVTAEPAPVERAAEPAQAELARVANPGEPAHPAAPTREVPASIADDVSKKLQAVGRPAEEADAAGQVTEAMWQTRAAAFEGKKGMPQEMYAREAPEIKAGRETTRTRQPEYAQKGAQGKIRLAEDGRATMTLMKTADASTFIHETGHDWLERMMRDAQDGDAPARMKEDGATVRRYLGLNEGEAISTKAHEKFARSFERYFMEGRAPTQALAGVFAKFKGWLTTIYQTVAKLRAPITPDIRDVFDRLLTENPERETAIVPESQGDMFAGEGQLPVNPQPDRPTPLYPKPPKEPTRMISYLRKAGGVRDDGGELASMLGGPKVRPGLIKETGMSLDEAAIRLHEDGYFPDHGDAIPTHRELLDAIESDLRGEPRYSVHDSDEAAAYHAAIEQNAEIERLSHDHDIDTTGMTREQFYDALAEKLSRVKQDEEIQSQAAAHEAEFDEAAAAAREWVEDQGHEWNADEFYDIEGPRSLDELESIHDGQADAARSEGQGEPNGSDAGPAAGRAVDGEEGDGSRGRGAGDTGRPGAADAGNAERPAAGSGGGAASADKSAEPNDPLPRANNGLIDKAGNIRIDNLNVPDDVAQSIRDAADANNDFVGARRGVISDAQVIDLANALGMKASDLNQRQLGQAFNAEQITAARKLLIDSASAVRDAAEKAANGSDADVVAYGEASARHRMIQEQVAGITAEAGRALRAFRMMGTEGEQVKALGDFLKQETGRDLFQMRREAKAVATLDSRAQISKFLVDSKKPDFWDKFTEYYTNNLISGPETHSTYAAGNELLAVWKAVPETAAAAAIGTVRDALGIEGERVYWGEVGAQLHGILFGQRDGFRAFVNALKTGITEAMPGEAEVEAQTSMFSAQRGRPGANGGLLGEVIRSPSRGVSAIHSYFRTIGYAQAKGALVYRQTMSEGLTGNAFDARVADLNQNPPPALMEAARTAANDQTMMGEGGDFTKALSRLSNTRIGGIPLPRFILPFVKVGSNVVRQALLERSPLGLIDQDIRNNLMGLHGSAARDSQISRILVGTSLGAVTFGLAAQGLVTGSGPTDPKAAATWRLTGNQPYSIKIGDTWYAYHKLGPLGMIMGVAADLNEFGSTMDEHGADSVTALMAVSIARNILNEGWMSGVSGAIQAMTQPEEYGASFVRNQGSTVLPFAVGMGQEAKAIDPYARQARSLTDAFMAKIPFLSENLMPRRDIWGQPIENKSDFGGTGLTSIAESRVNTDPVNVAMQRLHINAGMPERKITGIQLSDQQYDDFSRIAGRMAKMRLDALVNTPGFSSVPPGIQTKAITDTISSSRRTASELIKMQNPAIVSQAMQNKQNLLMHGRPSK